MFVEIAQSIGLEKTYNSIFSTVAKIDMKQLTAAFDGIIAQLPAHKEENA